MARLPNHGEDPWGDVRDAWDLTEHNADGTHKFGGTPTGLKFLRDDRTWQIPPGAYPASALVAFVDYAHGSDSNDGLSPGSAYKTIAAAYTALKTYAEAHFSAVGSQIGVGRIFLLPGDHDVGTGLLFDSLRPVEIVGSHQGSPSYYSPSASTIMSSSAAGTELVKVTHASTVGHGVSYTNVHFRPDAAVNTALTKAIYTLNTDYFHVYNCSFVNGDGSTLTNAITAIYQESSAPASDSAWFRIRDCISSNMQFYKNVGVNHNRSIMDGNVVFYGGTNPMVFFTGDMQRSTISNNDFSGIATAIKIDPSGAADANHFFNNSGESNNNANPFYDIASGVNNCHFIGGFCNCADNTNGTWIQFGTTAFNNQIYGAYDYIGANGYKQKIVDNSTGNGFNTIFHPSWGTPVRTFTTPTVTDSSFTPARPHNGVMAVTNNAGVRKLWTRVGGSWYSVTVA